METKNIELKYTNRNLISTITEQKNNIKTLNSKINELKSSKESVGSLEKLTQDYKNLIENYNKLQEKYKKSQEEIVELRGLVSENKPSNSLFGRFLKKKDVDVEDTDKKS